MAAGLHGSARTTPRIRAELQASQEATRILAARYSLNEKTVAKWRKRTTTTDQPMGPNRPRSTVLTEVEEAIIVEFRRRTLLPLAEGKLHMVLAIDRVSKFTHVVFFDAATQMNGAAFLREVIAAFPYAIHTVLTTTAWLSLTCPKTGTGRPVDG